MNLKIDRNKINAAMVRKEKKMRLNTEKYKAILEEKQFSDEDVRKLAGLSEKTYLWILDNGFIECEILERIADAADCKPGDILRPDYEGNAENVIEWVKDENRATLSLSQRRTITRVKRLAERYPDQSFILAENEDGSLYAHIPVSWIKINPPKELTKEQRNKQADLFRKNVLNRE